jgi:hypothetical protein
VIDSTLAGLLVAACFAAVAVVRRWQRVRATRARWLHARDN